MSSELCGKARKHNYMAFDLKTFLGYYSGIPGMAERLMRRSVTPFQVGSTPTPWTSQLSITNYELRINDTVVVCS